jgi:hypothetical protein
VIVVIARNILLKLDKKARTEFIIKYRNRARAQIYNAFEIIQNREKKDYNIKSFFLFKNPARAPSPNFKKILTVPINRL